jgi:hypothetical protein
VLTSFWSGLGGELAKHWAARLLTPALAFWLGGLAAVWWHDHGDDVRAHGWTRQLEQTAKPIEHLPSVAQGLLVVGALMLVAISGLLAERLTLPLLRLLEGYWPRDVRLGFGSLRRRNRTADTRRLQELAPLELRGGLTVQEYTELRRLEAAPDENGERLGALRRKQATGLTQHDAATISRLRLKLHYSPDDDHLAMPTRLGDILRTCERRPYEKYGLDAVVCWTSLWLVLPAEAKTELVETRGRLDGAVRTWLWGALFVVWTPWTIWALPIAVVIPVLAYYGGMLGAAKTFGDLIGTSFDLYRMELYDRLHLPRPASPAEERSSGQRVTNLLWGGLDDTSVKYVGA